MRFRPQDGQFTDLDEIRHHRPPNCVVRDGDVDYREIISTADEYAASGRNRHVIWETAAGVKFALELIPFRMPAGAVAVTVATQATAANGTVTTTPSQEGRSLNESGVLIAATEEAEDVAGLMFTDMYYHVTDQNELYRADDVTSLSEGDFLWLIRRGDVEVDVTAAVSDNAILISSATVAGEMQTAPAIDTTGTIAAYNTSLLQNLLGDANPRALGLGIAREAIVGAGLLNIRLLLPPRHVRTD